MEELRECPKGHSGNIKIELWGDWFTAACQEKGCGWQNGFWETEEEAATAWNTRATDPLREKMAEALGRFVNADFDLDPFADEELSEASKCGRELLQEYNNHVGQINQQSGERG